MVKRISTIILLLLMLAVIIFSWQLLGNKVTDLVDLRSEQEKEIMLESEEDIERIAAFVTHTTCIANQNACAGTKAEWLSLCAFLGSQKYTGASNTVNFRQAYPFVPNPAVSPYKASERFPFLKLRLKWYERIVAKSVMQDIKDSGHLGNFRRIKDEMVVPYLESGRDVSMIPSEYGPLCHSVVKMIRSDLAGLRSKRGWVRAVLLSDMVKYGYEEVARVTDEDARLSRPNSGRVYGDDFIFLSLKKR